MSEYNNLEEEIKENIRKKKEKNMKDLVFQGHMKKEVFLYEKRWVFKTITEEDVQVAYHAADFYEGLAYYLTLRLYVLSAALESVEDTVFLSKQMCYEFVNKLPMQIIMDVYDEYMKFAKEQEELARDIGEIKNLSETILVG